MCAFSQYAACLRLPPQGYSGTINDRKLESICIGQ